MKLRWMIFLILGVGLLWGTQGCVYSGGSLAPTVAVDPSQAFQTVQALLTATSSSQDSTLASPSRTAGSVTTSPSTAATTQPSQTPPNDPAATAVCDRAAAGKPIDVTIPDDTILEPGQAFTKIWKLENTGSCTWNKDYAAVFFYGDLMDAIEVIPLASYVEPGQSVEIVVEMVAPAFTGPFQGNWKLRNADGVLFGIGPTGDSPFWVSIIVVEPTIGDPTATSFPTFTPIPSETPLPTPLPSATPAIAVQSQLSLETDYLLDLDLAQVNPNQGADLAYRTGSVGYHWLIPQGLAQLGVYSEQMPELQDCQSASMSTAPIAVESLAAGLYLCYQTAQGQSGWMRLVAFDSLSFTLTLEILTWTTP